MASISQDELALLSGRELVAHLANSCLRADFEAVARVLDARERKLVKDKAALKAVLADLDAARAQEREVAEAKSKLEAVVLRKKYGSALDSRCRPLDSAKEVVLLLGGSVRRDESRVEEANEGEVKDLHNTDLYMPDCPAKAGEAWENSGGGGAECDGVRRGTMAARRNAAVEGEARRRAAVAVLKEMCPAQLGQGEG